MKRMIKLVMVLMCMFSGMQLSANQSTIKVGEYNDELKHQLSLNYEFVESKGVSIAEDVAVEYRLDGLVLIVDYSNAENRVTIYVNDYDSYELYLNLYKITTKELLENCVNARNTDNLFGASVIYKYRG